MRLDDFTSQLIARSLCAAPRRLAIKYCIVLQFLAPAMDELKNK